MKYETPEVKRSTDNSEESVYIDIINACHQEIQEISKKTFIMQVERPVDEVEGIQQEVTSKLYNELRNVLNRLRDINNNLIS